MKGREGEPWAWCNGFVSTVLDHACHRVGSTLDTLLPWSWSCSRTRRHAESGTYPCSWVDPEDVETAPVQPGDLMLVVAPGSSGARHIGVIVEVQGDLLITVEGNTSSGTRHACSFPETSRLVIDMECDLPEPKLP